MHFSMQLSSSIFLMKHAFLKHVTPWLIDVNVWQNPLQYCEVVGLQLIKINEKKNLVFKLSEAWKAVLIFKLDWDGYLLLWFVNLWVTSLVVRILFSFHTIFLYLLIFICNVRIKLASIFQSIGCNSEK